MTESQLDLLQARVVRTMRTTSTKWRVMFEHGGVSHWVSLNSKEIDLLVACGTGTLDTYTEAEHVFKMTDQPLIELIESRGTYKLRRVWNGKTFLGLEESKMTQVQKTATKTAGEMTVESLNNQVDGAYEKRRSDRERSREANDIVLTPEDLKRESAEIFRG